MHSVDRGWVNIRALTVVIGGLKFTKYFSSKVEGIAVDNAIFHLLISRSISDTFTVKV